MARIRSVHPGLFTDEVFASLSMASRVFLPGVWTECDDHGVFEWKPITLKMKIFPADSIDVSPLLDELLTADLVKRFTVDGKSFGVVRNFAKWQKPKNPSYRYELPDEYRNYVGLKSEHTPTTPPALPEDSPSPTEIGSLMEEGIGGGREEERKEDTSAGVSNLYAFEAGVIRLTQKDFDQWKRAFENLNLEAELLSLREWADKQGARRWFGAVSGALAKRNREAKLAREREAKQPYKWNGIEGVV